MFQARHLILGLVALLTVGSVQEFAAAQKESAVRRFSSPAEAARNEIEVMRQSKLMDVNHARQLGFRATDEVANVGPGAPLRVYRVGLKGRDDRKGLKDFRPGSDPVELLVDTHRVIYPLELQGTKEVRSSVTVTESKKDKSWHVARRGSPNRIRKLELLRKTRPSANMVVEIPALNLRFLGERKAGILMLVSIADRPKFELKAGQELPAHELFLRLKPEAERMLAQEGVG